MEYYSAINNKDIMKFAGKWIELENVMNVLTDNQRNLDSMFSLIGGIGHKYKPTILQFTDPKKLNKMGSPRKNV